MIASFETWLEPVRDAIRRMADAQDPDGVLRVVVDVLASVGTVWAAAWAVEEGGWRRHVVGRGEEPSDPDGVARYGRDGLHTHDPVELGEGTWARRHGVEQIVTISCAAAGETRGLVAFGTRWPLSGERAAATVMLAELAGGFLSAAHVRVKAESDRLRLAERLLHLQRLEGVGLLASGVAHDFNNLLAVIVGNASLALLRVDAEHPDRGLLQDVIATAERGEDLTHQLLAYSGKAPFRCETVDLAAQVGGLVGLLRTVMPRKVRLDLALQPAWVEADVAQLQQLAMNLVMNAAESIAEGPGEVCVSTGTAQLSAEELEERFPGEGRRPGRYAWLEVEDTGAGMDAETRARIFDPFFTTKGMGRGLGLPAVQEIARNHDGAVQLDSTPGQGSWFRVWFPAAVADAASPGAEVAESPRGAGLVLVVDDLPEVRATARLMLEHLGYTVIEAEDGQHALKKVQDHLHDLSAILLDLSMPVMDGEELLIELESLPRAVPVVLSSGYSDTAERLADRGVENFLQKPYTVQQLARALARATQEG